MYIRHLHLHSTVLLNSAASLISNNGDSSCSWNLRSLSLNDDMGRIASGSEHAIDKLGVLEQVTDLIGANTNTSLTLTIGDTYLPRADADLDYPFFNAIRGLHNMAEFNCGYRFVFKLSDVPGFWPRLRTYMFYYGVLDLDGPVLGLRCLAIRNVVYLQNVVDILNNLPDLEHLEIEQIYNTRDAVHTRQTMDPSASPRALKSLSIPWTKNTQEETFQILFSWLPNLTKLTMHDFEVLIDTRKPALARTCDLTRESHTLEFVLKSCSNLRVFDALGHRFMLRWQMLTPWACTKLETFRCQILGVRRLTRSNEVAYRRAVDYQEKGRRLNAKKVKILQHHQAILDDHALVNNQLARLPQLRVLEIGFDHRKRRSYGLRASRCEFLDYSKPLQYMPEFSLDSGLGKLSVLKELKVFEFEGVDYRIGTKELDWMTESWPKLRMLRGLEKDTLPRIRFDEQKALLRNHLRRLRPEIQHESLGAFGLQ
ncbi:hypothetical protein BG015_007807 [Linnemannia schmuckeri]|uniref:F-box domain-containing protein n=1 Tax=Linnemannia schmuckeri TaxID=64567 RepID=A0A9P5S0G7_9FUNG|nr:hypothetical protein BG015_007807 [Linnemannia schmuckeri]